ncbi:MAG: DUF2505 domain-containing protein [Acidipropionibacterium jensenii]|nr:DUF2505 domain-containing protein [Acidipropionibacterium jensenii]
MDINTSAQFAADPNTVCAMMTDPSWWQDVYRRIGATTSDVTVTDTGLSLDLALPAPSQVKKFVGETMADLAVGGPGSVITYTGEFTVSIPLVGRKLESTAGPYITRAFDVQQEAGNDYLSARSAQ